jgi:hypothetical protein
VTSVVGLFLLGGALGFGGAYVVRAYRAGQRGRALAIGTVVAGAAAYLLWQALMVMGVGPSLR